jgi:hypothetical protein
MSEVRVKPGPAKPEASAAVAPAVLVTATKVRAAARATYAAQPLLPIDWLWPAVVEAPEAGSAEPEALAVARSPTLALPDKAARVGEPPNLPVALQVLAALQTTEQLARLALAARAVTVQPLVAVAVEVATSAVEALVVTAFPLG